MKEDNKERGRGHSKKNPKLSNNKKKRHKNAQKKSGYTNTNNYKPVKKVNKKVDKPAQLPVEDEMRLNKYLAHSGVCSRRKASEYIQQGEVTVNDKVILEMGHKVLKGDVVKFQGKTIKPVREAVYILLNKPKNVITTLKDEKGRRTVAEFIKEKTKERVYPVGRLDRNTTGLLVLTNDGDLAQKLSHPSYEVKKVYKATLDKKITEEDLEQIRNTLQLEDGPAPVDDVAYASDNKKVVGIELHIGRNRIVRRIFAHLGYEVVKLDRVMYSSLTKKNLPVGYSRFLTKHELVLLKHLV
jgi:23S rRNA pseudouridine2605 synthase